MDSMQGAAASQGTQPEGLPLGLNPFCAYSGCRARSAYQVGVMITARCFRPRVDVPIPHMTTLTVCDDHKGIPKPGHLLTSDARKHIRQSVPGVAVDFNTAKIVLKKIGGGQ